MKNYCVAAIFVAAIMGLLSAGCATTSKGLSDEEQIMRQLQEAIASLQSKDFTLFEKYVSKSFYTSVIGDRDDLLAYLKAAESMGFLDDIEVDTSEIVVTVEGDGARMDGVTASGIFGHQGLSFEGVKENGAWVITGLTPY